MKYLSVCSGIEAATVAWHHMGWQPVAFSEIEPFPSAVLAHHYPNVPNVGDMTKFQEWNLEPIDLLVGGTPCQSFSVAGLRKGLADPRGNLMLTYLAIAERYRPEWLVWENVPGVLSSNGGRDFGTFLGALGQLGYGFAYRVLDAQYFGVAQRRRRVFVVANARDWRRAAAVLFDSESLRGNPAPSREKGQEVAGTIAARFGISRNNHEERVTGELKTFSTPAIGDIREDDVSSTITKNTGAGGETQNPAFVAQPVAFYDYLGTHGGGVEIGVTPTLKKKDGVAVTVQPVAIGLDEEQNAVVDGFGTLKARTAGGGFEGVVAHPVAFRDPSPTLTARMQGSSGWAPANEDAHLVGEAQPVAVSSGYGWWSESDGTAQTLRAQDSITKADTLPIVGMQVRRLTPVECERLQGFPDGYTNIPWRKKPESPDGPRYKALGNSMAVPVMRWIGERINMVPK